MQMLAPTGSEQAGTVWTIRQIRRTCQFLDNGYYAGEVLDSYLAVAAQSGASRSQVVEMNKYSIAIMAVSAVRLCPRHKRQIDRAIGF
jgi:hypothetical protein